MIDLHSVIFNSDGRLAVLDIVNLTGSYAMLRLMRDCEYAYAPLPGPTTLPRNCIGDSGVDESRCRINSGRSGAELFTPQMYESDIDLVTAWSALLYRSTPRTVLVMPYVAEMFRGQTYRLGCTVLFVPRKWRLNTRDKIDPNSDNRTPVIAIDSCNVVFHPNNFSCPTRPLDPPKRANSRLCLGDSRADDKSVKVDSGFGVPRKLDFSNDNDDSLSSAEHTSASTLHDLKHAAQSQMPRKRARVINDASASDDDSSGAESVRQAVCVDVSAEMSPTVPFPI